MEREPLDVLVVGGGVVGAGTALDAVSRGLSTALVEQRDYASGTSSRSSKLVHGGLRYLEMLDFAPGPGGPPGARAAAPAPRAAPRPAGAVPLPAAPHLGAARTSAPACCCTTGWRCWVCQEMAERHGRAASPAPAASRPRPGRPRPAHRRPRRRDPLLRLPGRRRAAGDDDRPHGRGLRRPHGLAHQGDRLPARGRPGRRRPGRGPRERPRDRGAGAGGGQCRRRLDQRDPGDARRPRRTRRRGEQGRAPRRTP